MLLYQRRQFVRNCAAGALLARGSCTGAHAAELAKIRYGFANKAVLPLIADLLIPEYLGWYKEEGLTFEAVPLGTSGTALAALTDKRIEFATNVAAFQIPIVAKGEVFPAVDFFEFTYPFKYGVAVKPGSSVHGLADLKGKRVGVPNIGNQDFAVGQQVFKAAGLDPANDISWVAVGEGGAARIAFDRNDIDALFTFDVNFGEIEATGMKLDYVKLPPGIPMIGGVFMSATPEMLKQHRDWAVGLGRSVAKAHIFIQENPEAAAYIYAKMFPQAGKSIEEQTKAVLVPINKRKALYKNYDPSVTQAGFISKAEWQEEVRFAGLQDMVMDVSGFFTNDLIADINKFDAEAVRKQARDFKLPWNN